MRPRVALVTSGIGTAYGGIGVVAQLIVSALANDTEVSLWRHPASLPRFLRVGILGARTLMGTLTRPDLVIYEHVHLAVLHAAIPALRHVPYVVFLMGTEVWEPLVGRRREALVRRRPATGYFSDDGGHGPQRQSVAAESRDSVARRAPATPPRGCWQFAAGRTDCGPNGAHGAKGA